MRRGPRGGVKAAWEGAGMPVIPGGGTRSVLIAAGDLAAPWQCRPRAVPPAASPPAPACPGAGSLPPAPALKKRAPPSPPPPPPAAVWSARPPPLGRVAEVRATADDAARRCPRRQHPRTTRRSHRRPRRTRPPSRPAPPPLARPAHPRPHPYPPVPRPAAGPSTWTGDVPGPAPAAAAAAAAVAGSGAREAVVSAGGDRLPAAVNEPAGAGFVGDGPAPAVWCRPGRKALAGRSGDRRLASLEGKGAARATAKGG